MTLIENDKIKQNNENNQQQMQDIFERLISEIFYHKCKISIYNFNNQSVFTMFVKISARVRPMHQHQKAKQYKICVGVANGNTLRITNSQNSNEKEFQFDDIFFSPSLTNEEMPINQESAPVGNQQDTIFDSFQDQMIPKMFKGQKMVMLAYGQTGAGKTYTMKGSNDFKGIIYKFYNELLHQISLKKSQETQFDLNISFMTIYNEVLQDETVPPNQRPHGGLKIKQNKQIGVYVENLSKHQANDNHIFGEFINLASENKNIQTTLMSTSTSRYTEIISIEMSQKTKDKIAGEKVVYSQMKFVDLVGSQKIGKTGQTESKMLEVKNISKSLNSLSQVLTCLVDPKSKFIPFRDSKLTRLLQQELKANIFVICVISPASNNYQESLSTLRFGERIRRMYLQKISQKEEKKEEKQLSEKEIECQKLWEVKIQEKC